MSQLRLMFLLVSVCGFAAASYADSEPKQRSDQLKAAYLFNFVQFVEWPPEKAAGALQICFAGASGVHDALGVAVLGKRVGERPFAVRTLGKGEAPGDCAVVYSENPSADAELLHSARLSALTVGEAEGFTRQGGVIQLFTQSNRLRFVVNVGNAKRARLRISSNLLKLASSVEEEPAP